MAPQDDLTAERAVSIVGIIDGLAYIDPNDHRKCEEAIRPIIQQVRQEALREAARVVNDYNCRHNHGKKATKACDDIFEALYRLASEGG